MVLFCSLSLRTSFLSKIAKRPVPYAEFSPVTAASTSLFVGFSPSTVTIWDLITLCTSSSGWSVASSAIASFVAVLGVSALVSFPAVGASC